VLNRVSATLTALQSTHTTAHCSSSCAHARTGDDCDGHGTHVASTGEHKLACQPGLAVCCHNQACHVVGPHVAHAACGWCQSCCLAAARIGLSSSQQSPRWSYISPKNHVQSVLTGWPAGAVLLVCSCWALCGCCQGGTCGCCQSAGL
jgi:hypothetical protein